MAEMTYYLPVPAGQHLFIHYDGAIREAIYLRTEFRASGVCGNNSMPTEFFFKVAGLQDEIFLEHYDFQVYYSLRDAKACENRIKLKLVESEFYNTYTKKFLICGGCASAWIWDETKPSRFNVCSWPTFVFDGNDVQMKNDGVPVMIRSRWYKTKEECIANNEAQVFTF